jgi:hypothetical protein
MKVFQLQQHIRPVKKAVRDWKNRNHKKYWKSLTELKHAKRFLQGLSARRNKELLKLNKSFMMGERTTHRTLSRERTPFQNGIK